MVCVCMCVLLVRWHVGLSKSAKHVLGQMLFHTYVMKFYKRTVRERTPAQD
jgi:hypothetical protein